MTSTAELIEEKQVSRYERNDVRFVASLPGRYAFPDRSYPADEKPPVYACRLCSISTRVLVALGPVTGEEDEIVSLHVAEFGILHCRITRKLPSGFVTDIMMSESDRDKLGAKIEWQKKRVRSKSANRRDHKRIQPRNPRSVLTQADGTTLPCFVIDISQSGAAISAHFWPKIGTPVLVGRLPGHVVRYLDVGFAVKFLDVQEIGSLETLLRPNAA